jgi:uncharacterized membrane protein HdeD (DUF308 family)
MEKQITKNWYMFLIKGIIMLVLSLFVLINPEGTLKTVAFYIGIGFLISGIILVIRNIPGKNAENFLNWNLTEGIADLILGILLIIAPLAMAALIPIIIGIWAAIYSIIMIIDSVKGTGNSVMKLITGITILLLSNVLIFKPLLLGLTIVIWLGILLLVAGAFNIILSVKMKQTIKMNP